VTHAGYRLIDHTADFGLELWAPDALQLFSHAADVLFKIILDSDAVLTPKYDRTLHVQGDDWADLMVNWLRELLYLWHGHGQVVLAVKLEALTANHLKAAIVSDDFRPSEHAVLHEIKAVTYHQVEVGPCSKGWCARVIFDV
jgi:SHS2 domain-containing protein